MSGPARPVDWRDRRRTAGTVPDGGTAWQVERKAWPPCQRRVSNTADVSPVMRRPRCSNRGRAAPDGRPRYCGNRSLHRSEPVPAPPGHRSLKTAGVIRRVSVLNATARRLSLPEELAMATQMAARQQRGSVSRFISPFAPANHIRRGTREDSQGQRVARGV